MTVWPDGGPARTYLRLCSDGIGESHFEEVELPLQQEELPFRRPGPGNALPGSYASRYRGPAAGLGARSGTWRAAHDGDLPVGRGRDRSQ